MTNNANDNQALDTYFGACQLRARWAAEDAAPVDYPAHIQRI